jgi:hypothetical protein
MAKGVLNAAQSAARLAAVFVAKAAQKAEA